MEEGRLPKGALKWQPSGGRKRGRPKLSWVEGISGMVGRRLERKNQMEEEDFITAKWVQEDVETLYSLLNK
jgi:hypothetical protein